MQRWTRTVDQAYSLLQAGVPIGHHEQWGWQAAPLQICQQPPHDVCASAAASCSAASRVWPFSATRRFRLASREVTPFCFFGTIVSIPQIGGRKAQRSRFTWLAFHERRERG